MGKEKWGEEMLLRDEIERLRNALNNAIQENSDNELIYKLSTQLDELIVNYYKETEVKVS